MSNHEGEAHMFQAYLIGEIQNDADVLTVPSESTLYSQGEKVDDLFIVKSGLIYTSHTRDEKLSVSSRPAGKATKVIDGIYRGGSIVGGELFDVDKHHGTAIAATKAELYMVDREKLFLQMSSNLALFSAIANVLTMQINEAEEHESVINRGTAKQKVVKAIDDFTYQKMVVADQYMLSERSGLVREEFNRTLRNKKKYHK